MRPHPRYLTCAAHESPVPQVRVRSVDANLGFAHDTSPTIFDMCRPVPQVRVRSVDANLGFAHDTSPTIFDMPHTEARCPRFASVLWTLTWDSPMTPHPRYLTCAAHESPVPQVRVRSVDANLGFAHDTSPTIFDMSRTRKPGAPGSRPFCGR